MTARLLKLENRAVLKITGPDASKFLQGLITNDIALLDTQPALYAAILTPQGKFLFDLIIVKDGDALLLDIEAKRLDILLTRLTMYKLRADIEISAPEDMHVWALWGEAEAPRGIAYPDPRHDALEARVIAADTPVTSYEPLDPALYHETRIKNGVPDGSTDMLAEKYFWLETNAEALNGVSFTKGCYVGQELTARMKHRTTLKKKLLPVELSGDAKPGDTVETEEGKEAGQLHSIANGYAMAYMRLEKINKPLFIAGSDTRVTLMGDHAAIDEADAE